MDNQERARLLRERLDAIGISDRQFSVRSGVNRGTLATALSGKGVTDSIWRAIDATLSTLEEEHGMDRPEAKPRLVTYRLFGGEVVVEGPVENLAELEASVARLLRQMREEGQ